MLHDSPSMHDVFSDANVSASFTADQEAFLASLPADDVPTDADLDEQWAEEQVRREAATVTPKPWRTGVEVHGRRFKALVIDPAGRRYKAGTHTDEAAAWFAATRLLAELQADVAHVA